ncbi:MULTISPECIES: ABC transporter substrate-binding protein [Subtercola]|uniref:Extracellular solute-binding protein n=1 Tax=Subtercola vilae TaxID=2056433 RepID=A0A4T2CCG4_9MICO|nr:MULTISPECIES: extracellular solute-binding protein [Subtercola]MEA9983968.1 extracellular solute-binding protein [Subtercola sp. RTI3]TIH40961.1 extracellular solute-binding protein [Subtercola vilae]
MARKTRIWTGSIALSVAVALSLSACAPGGTAAPAASSGPVSTDVASAGPVTLTVWDQNTDEGITDAQEALNAAFTKKYPNVTINRVTQSFADLKTTLKLALSGDNPPDVIQANQGYPDMGAFVQGGLIRSLNDYNDVYKWSSYYPESLLKINSFSADGKKWQGDNLYGISQTGEVVGVYYNKKILTQLGVAAPTSLASLETDMAAAKSAGILPMAYGDIEKSPGIHLFGIVQASLAGADAVNKLVTGQGGAWTDDVSVKAATTIQNWSDEGYITKGASGISRDDALAQFEAGKSAFYVVGTWKQAAISATLGADAGFTTLIPAGGTTPVTTGGEGLAWAVTTGSKHPDVSAAYIDFINNADAAQTFIDKKSLPSVIPAGYTPTAGLETDVFKTYGAVTASGGLVPYLDYSTPTFYDTLTSAVQQLTDDQVTPKAFTEILQKDYSSFLSSK